MSFGSLFPEPREIPQLKLFSAADAESEAGADLRADHTTLPEFWDAFFRPVRLIGADPRTLKEDRVTCRKWQKYAGDRALSQIDRRLLAEFVPWLIEQGLGTVTATKHLNRVQTWLRAAGPDPGDGLCAELLAKVLRVKPPRCPTRQPDKAFRLAEIGSWLDACHKAKPLKKLSMAAPAWWQSIVLFDYACPLRIEAVTAARWEWLSQDEQGYWWLNASAESDKKDTERVYYVSSHAWRALELLGPRKETGLIFGLPLSFARLYTHARELLSHSQVSAARRQQRVFHGLRAAADTELRRLRFPIAAKRALGRSVGRDVDMGFYTGTAEYVEGMEAMPMPAFTRWREPQLRLF